MKANFLNMLIGLMMLSIVAGCSDKDDPNNAPGDYSLKVKVDCTASDSNDSPIQLAVVSDTVIIQKIDIEPGTSFSRNFEFEVPEVPSTAGFALFPSIKEEGGKSQFSVMAEVTLMKGSKTVSSKIINDALVVTNLEEDHTAAYLFEVTQNGLIRVDIVDDDIDSSKEKPESKEDYTRADSINDITKHVKPYDVNLLFEDDVPAEDYRNPAKKQFSTTTGGLVYSANKYNVTSKIYNVFDENKNENYYFIEQFITTSFAPSYAGIYNRTISTGGCPSIAKICEWYGDYVDIETSPDLTTFTDMQSKTPTIPETAEMNVSRTCGFSSSIGAKVTYSPEKGAGGEVSASLSASRTYSYQIPDVKIANNCMVNDFFSWRYYLKSAETVCNPFCTAWTNMRAPSEPGQHTMTKQTAFAFSTKSKKPVIYVKLEVGLKSTAGKCGDEHGTRTRNSSKFVKIQLPYWEYNGGSLKQIKGDTLFFSDVEVHKSW